MCIYIYIYIYQEFIILSRIFLNLDLRIEWILRYKAMELENTTIIAHEINKLCLQILEALHIKTKNLKSIELILKMATMF